MINEATGWYDKNISPQAYKVIRSKRKDKAVADTMKQYDKINSQKVHSHKEENMGSASYEDEGSHLSNTQPRNEWNGERMSPKAHVSSTPRRIYTN